MKGLVRCFVGMLASAFALTACDNWIETEIMNSTDLISSNKDAAYYERLRKYKNTDHQVAFGWFGNWTGTGASYENSLKGLPDSVDFVSLWGNWKNPSPAMIEDLRYVQKNKNTKALVCFLVLDIGDQITPPMPQEEVEKGTTMQEWRHQYWGWDYSLENRLAAVERYANALCDTIEKYDYDGFDLDAEPEVEHPFDTDKELWENGKEVITKFITTLSKRIGPKSKSGKMFVIDGQPHTVPDTLFSHFDYLILQTYTSYFKQDNSRLNEKFEKQYEHFKNVASADEIAKKIIVCEDFEKYAKGGGADFTLPNGSTTNSLTGFALWNPAVNGKQYAKGGVGTFHMEYEYKANPQSTQTYPALRKAIQIQNPSKK